MTANIKNMRLLLESIPASSRFNFIFVSLFLVFLIRNQTPTVSSTSEFCPQKCKCFHNARRVECVAGGFTNIPDGISENVEHLDLRQNALRQIGLKGLSRLKNLHTLFLTQNQIRHLDENWLVNYTLDYLSTKTNDLLLK